MKPIIGKIIQVTDEMGKEVINQVIKTSESIITGRELLGDIKPMSEGELNKHQGEEEKKSQQEAADIRAQISGRDVEKEIEQIRKEKSREEEEKEKQEKEFLENVKRQREEEAQELSMMIEPSSKPARGKMGGGQKRAKKEDMSETKEYGKKKD